MDIRIRIHAIGHTHYLKISQARAEALEAARAAIRAGIDIEELYHVIIDDYIEFERSVHDTIIQYVVRRRSAIEEFDVFRRLYARRLAHLLSSCRAYLDATPKLMSQPCLGISDAKLRFAHLTSQQYDKSFHYRFGEALRNSAQHRGLPVHGLTMGGEWIGGAKKHKHRLKYTAVPTASISELEHDRKFKRAVLEEAKCLGVENIDIRPILRGYVEGLSNIHMEVRGIVDATVSQSAAAIDSAIADYNDTSPTKGTVVGHAVVKMTSDVTWDFLTPLSDRGTTLFAKLKMENLHLKNLLVSFASSEIDG